MTGETLSHVEWVQYHVGRALETMSIKELADRSCVSPQAINGARSAASCSINTVERIAEALDMTVAEILLAPTVQTEWYREARKAYFAPNMRQLVEECGVPEHLVARAIHASMTSLRYYMSSGPKHIVPRLQMLQRIADYFEMEVADLFLPPEGKC